MTIIPPINLKGVFKLSAPYDTVVTNNEVLTVIGIRSLSELSTLDPLNTIYIAYGMSQEDMDADDADNVPIIVLETSANDKIYIPADRIAETPRVDGVIYNERTIVIPLGPLPVDLNVDSLLGDIEAVVKDFTGIAIAANDVVTSGDIMVDAEEDKRLTAIRTNGSGVYLSYRTRLEQALVREKRKDNIINELKNHILNNNS